MDVEPSATRDRLTSDVYLPEDIEEPVAALEAALVATIAAEPIESKLKQARRSGAFEPGLMTGGDVDEVWHRARDAGVISEDEYQVVARRNMLRDKVIRVDDFPYDLDLKAALDGMQDASPARTETA